MSAPAGGQRPRTRNRIPRRTPETLTSAQYHRVERAAESCSDVLADGWREAVADRANTYVPEPTWNRLFRGNHWRRCRLLADVAKAILDGKTKLHNLLGSFAGRIADMLGASSAEQQFARELAKKLPLPVDAKLVATARSIQITGIVLCLANGDDPTRCQCFIDLALAEAKTRVKQLLVAAMEDWQGLGHFPP